MFLGDPRVLAHSYKATRAFWVEDGVIHVGLQSREVYWIEVIWPIDASGGESPPMTWTYGSRTYSFKTGDPDIGYAKLNGTYRAIYEETDPWADV